MESTGLGRVTSALTWTEGKGKTEGMEEEWNNEMHERKKQSQETRRVLFGSHSSWGAFLNLYLAL